MLKNSHAIEEDKELDQLSNHEGSDSDLEHDMEVSSFKDHQELNKNGHEQLMNQAKDTKQEDNVFVRKANKSQEQFEKDLECCIEMIKTKALIPRSLLTVMTETGACFLENFKNKKYLIYGMMEDKINESRGFLTSSSEELSSELERAREEMQNLVNIISNMKQYDPRFNDRIYKFVKLLKDIFKKLRERNESFDISGMTSRRLGLVIRKNTNVLGKNKRRFVLAIVGGQKASKSTLLNFLLRKNIMKTGSSRCSKVIIFLKKNEFPSFRSKFVVMLKANLTREKIKNSIQEIRNGLDLNGKHAFSQNDKSLNVLEAKYASIIEKQLLEAIERLDYADNLDTFTDTSTFSNHPSKDSKSLPQIILDYSGSVSDDHYYQIYAYGFFVTKLVDHVVIYDEDCPFDAMDIPGSGSDDVPIENINSPILKEADLFILAKSCNDTSLKQEDNIFCDFLHTNALNKIVFVMTKSDTLQGDDGLQEIENTYQAYKRKCTTRLHDKHYLVSCIENVKNNQLLELRNDIYELMQNGLWKEVKEQLESVVSDLKVISDTLFEEFNKSFDNQVINMLEDDSIFENSSQNKEEKQKFIINSAKNLDHFDTIFKSCKEKLNEMINTTSIYNMQTFTQALMKLFDQHVGVVESADSSNIRPGLIKNMMKKLTGGSLAIDDEKANIKVREKTFRSIQKSFSECSRKIGCMMHKEFVMTWVKILSAELNINATNFLTFITENDFSMKIESLIMHRASPVIEYFVRWASYNSEQRAHLQEYLQELGINIQADKNSTPPNESIKSKFQESDMVFGKNDSLIKQSYNPTFLRINKSDEELQTPHLDRSNITPRSDNKLNTMQRADSKSNMSPLSENKSKVPEKSPKKQETNEF